MTPKSTDKLLTGRVIRSTKARFLTMENPESLMNVQRRSDGEKKDMGQTSGTSANDDAKKHVSDGMLNKDDTSKFKPMGAPTEQNLLSSSLTPREYPTEEEPVSYTHLTLPTILLV